MLDGLWTGIQDGASAFWGWIDQALMPVWDWFSWLYDTTGVNLPIFYDEYYRGLFFTGLLYTIYLSLAGLVLSVSFGILGAWALGLKSGFIRRPVQMVVDFIRYTPPLVQMFLYYYGVSNLLTTTTAQGLEEPLLGPFAWAALAISIYTGASNVIIFRSGIDSVSRNLSDAASAMGMAPVKVFGLVVLPLAFRQSLPTLNSNLVNMVKMTGLASAISVPETLLAVNQVTVEEFNYTEMMNVLLVTFFLLVSFLVIVMGRWERRLRLPGVGK